MIPPESPRSQQADLHPLVVAVAALNPQPRRHRWTSVTYCICDAVWSIGAHYDHVVTPLVHRVAAHMDDDHALHALHSPDELLPPDGAPLPDFVAHFPEPAALAAVTNCQLTSPRGGVPKAQVALAHARVFIQHGVRTLSECQDLLGDAGAFQALDSALRRLPGEGQHGIRRGYLWMLLGDEDRVKPDRMILRWLAGHGHHVDAVTAARLLVDVAQQLSTERTVTAWEVDHAIWSAQRTS